MNWCAVNRLSPADADDDALQRFRAWLESRTLHARPGRLVQQVPKLWSEAKPRIPGWPDQKLSRVTFRAPSPHLRWEELHPAFQADADAYLNGRANPDPFADDPLVPTKPLAPSTIALQRKHITLAASVLIRSGTPAESLTSLSDLITPESMKGVLRHYHQQAGGKPNAFATGLSITLIHVARYHVRVGDRRLAELRIAGKLPSVPFDLTDKNKRLIEEVENETVRARLLCLAEELMRSAKVSLGQGHLKLVDAQVALAAEILLVAPLRPENLIDLNFSKNFKEPQGPRGKLVLRVPKDQTKTKRRDLAFEFPPELAVVIRWYRSEVLPQVGGDPNGYVFIKKGGEPKSQETLSQQITERIERHVGIHVTPHQFRHLAAALYLEDHPEDFQTATDLLGHSFAKTDLDLCRRLLAPRKRRLWQNRYGAASKGTPQTASPREAGKMKQPPTLKHLPIPCWPAEDRAAFERAFAPGDLFDDTAGAGAHLASRSRRTILFGWRRWLGFLSSEHPNDLELSPADRVTPARVRDYVAHLSVSGMKETSVAITVTQLYNAARLIAPDRDWQWLKALKRRLHARDSPEDRFERLVPAHETLDLGIALMDSAEALATTGHMERELRFRDGLVLALLSLWPIRRRSLAALTVDRHLRWPSGNEQIDILLYPEDTKGNRAESWPVPALLRPYLRRYLDEIRPRLLRGWHHDALWVGQRGHALNEGGLYAAICRRTATGHSPSMSPHDFRRAAATFIAMEQPEKVGLIPGVLQHVSPTTGDQHYNLARSVSASRRHSATLVTLKSRLRPAAR